MVIKARGIVIKEHIFGESDKYITLFTKEQGRIQVLAPKAKKTDKGFASATQLFVYADFMLITYKDTYRLIGVDLIEMFHGIRRDLKALSYASYIMEFIQYVTQPGLQQQNLLQLTLITLQALAKEGCICEQIRRVYEIRAFALLGFMPQLEACTECGEAVTEEGIYYFSPQGGGVVCGNCQSENASMTALSYGVRYTLLYILTAENKMLYHFRVTKEIQRVLDEVGDHYLNYYIESPFKTLDFINRLSEI